MPLVSQGSQDYVTIEDVAQAFGLTSREDRLAGGMTLTVGARSIIVTPDQPVVSVSGRLVPLSAAPVRQSGRWLVPVDFLARAVGPALDTRIDVRRASRLAIVGDMRVPRIATRVDTQPGSTTITFDVAPATSSRVTLETGRLVVAFEADLIDLSAPAIAPSEFLQSLQVIDPGNAVRIVTGPRFGMHRATSSQPEAGASRLVIELLPTSTDAAAPVASPPPAPPTAAVDVPLPGAFGSGAGFRTVVIDAGHGGDDTGTRGAGGAVEKDVTLSIAQRLRAMIERNLGLRVFLTRDDDRALTLDERSAYANSQKADVFISVHANASLSGSLKGAEVYRLSSDGGEDGVGDMGEGGVQLPVLGGGSRPIMLIPWDAAQAQHVDRSATLAAIVEQALRARVPVSPRAIQLAPLRVLVGANMPAVLVEVGYLSNADQERALMSSSFQDEIGQALFDAVAQFRQHVERTRMPTARTR